MILERLLQGLMQVAQSIVQFIHEALPDVVIPEVTGLVHGYTFLDSIVPLHEVIDLAIVSVQVITVLGAAWGVLWAVQRVKSLPFL